METIPEFQERLNSLVASINKEDIEYKEFITHKYLLLALHAYTERCLLENTMKEKPLELVFKKQYRLYQSIESLLEKKANELGGNEMYEKIIASQNLVNTYSL